MTRGWVYIETDKCKGCELCTTVCPSNVLHMATDRFNAKGYHPVELVETEDAYCTGCGLCAMICPDVVLTVFREPRRPRRRPAPKPVSAVPA